MAFESKWSLDDIFAAPPVKAAVLRPLQASELRRDLLALQRDVEANTAAMAGTQPFEVGVTPRHEIRNRLSLLNHRSHRRLRSSWSPESSTPHTPHTAAALQPCDMSSRTTHLRLWAKHTQSVVKHRCLAVPCPFGFDPSPPAEGGKVGGGGIPKILTASQARKASSDILCFQALELEKLKLKVIDEVGRMRLTGTDSNLLVESSTRLANAGIFGLRTSQSRPNFATRPSALFPANQKSWPTHADCLTDYSARMGMLPVLHFRDTIAMSDKRSLPDLRQDIKDLSRDTLKINGCVFEGTVGYRRLVSVIADLIDDPLAGTRHVSLPSEPHNQTDERGGVDNKVSSASDSSQEKLPTGRGKSQTLAMVLLHILNRTLTGGLCLERVLQVFQCHPFAVCVPDSRCAQPLEVIIIGSGASGHAVMKDESTNGVRIAQAEAKHFSVASAPPVDSPTVGGSSAVPQPSFVGDLPSQPPEEGVAPRAANRRRRETEKARGVDDTPGAAGECHSGGVDESAAVGGIKRRKASTLNGQRPIDETRQGDSSKGPIAFLRSHLRYTVHDAEELQEEKHNSVGCIDAFFSARIDLGQLFEGTHMQQVEEALEQQIQSLRILRNKQTDSFVDILNSLGWNVESPEMEASDGQAEAACIGSPHGAAAASANVPSVSPPAGGGKSIDCSVFLKSALTSDMDPSELHTPSPIDTLSLMLVAANGS